MGKADLVEVYPGEEGTQIEITVHPKGFCVTLRDLDADLTFPTRRGLKETKMKKTWTINNGWNRLNAEGQLVLCEIGPAEFWPDYEAAEAAAATYGERLPYEQHGSQYCFARKRDYQLAVDTLRAAGYIA